MENQTFYVDEQQVEYLQQMQLQQQIQQQQQQEFELYQLQQQQLQLQQLQELELFQQQQLQIQLMNHPSRISYDTKLMLLSQEQEQQQQQEQQQFVVLEKKAFDLKHKFIVFFIYNRLLSPNNFIMRNYLYVYKLRNHLKNYMEKPTENILDKICEECYMIVQYMERFKRCNFGPSHKINFCVFLKSILSYKLIKKKIVIDRALINAYDEELRKYKRILDDLQQKLLLESQVEAF